MVEVQRLCGCRPQDIVGVRADCIDRSAAGSPCAEHEAMVKSAESVVGADSRAVLARFDAERQALAVMDHPNIARVYDGGVTPSGRPFFVMELVEGVPITKFCDERRRPPRDRLRLFVQVCAAVTV